MIGSFRPPGDGSDREASGFERLRKRLFADAILYTVVRASTGVAALVLLIVLSHAMAPEDLGLFSLLSNAAVLVAVGWYGWLGSASYRFSPTYRSAGRLSELRALTVKTYAVLAAVLIAMVFLSRLVGFDEAENLSPTLFAAVLILVVSLGPAQSLLELYRVDGERGNYVRGTLLLGLGPLAIVLIAAWVADVTVAIVVWSQAAVAASIGIFVALSWIGGRRSSRADTRAALKKFSSYGFPYVGGLVASWVLSVADRYLIASILGSHDVGTYTAGYQLATAPFGFLFAATVAPVEPLYLSAHEDGEETRAGTILGKTFTLFLIAGTLLLLVLWMARNELAVHMLGGAYVEAAEVIPLAALGAGLMSLGLLRQQVLIVTRQTRRAFTNLAGAAVLSIGLNLLLIPRFGNRGAALASAIAYGVFLLTAVLSTRGRYSFPLPLQWIKAWLVATVAGVAMALVGGWLLRGSTPRVVAFTILTGVVYVAAVLAVSRGTLLSFVKNLR